MSKQKYSSSETSINSSKLPSIYKRITVSGLRVLDYGCGKYTDHIREYAMETLKCASWTGYDKYNQPITVNEEALKNRYDVCLISNVLNVIAEDEIIDSIVEEAKQLANTVLITVYVGDKSGKGRVTKKDCYQRNCKLEWYKNHFAALGYTVEVKKNVLKVG